MPELRTSCSSSLPVHSQTPEWFVERFGKPLGKMSAAGVAKAQEALRQVWRANPEVLDPISRFYGIDVQARIEDAATGSGQVVGVSDAADGYWHAFLWQNGAMTNLGTLPGGTRSEAYGINDLGQVVGYAWTADVSCRAVLWTPVPEPSSLLALLCGLGGMAGIVRYRRR